MVWHFPELGQLHQAKKNQDDYLERRMISRIRVAYKLNTIKYITFSLSGTSKIDSGEKLTD